MTSEMRKLVSQYNFSIALTKINLKKSPWPLNSLNTYMSCRVRGCGSGPKPKICESEFNVQCL